MENNTKSWLAGCGCGCLAAATLFIVAGASIVGICYALWETDTLRTELVSGPAALVWGSLAGIVAGGLAGLVSTLVVRKIATKKLSPPDPDRK